jgi:GNAT superfamily N-acetyltransferase
MGIRFVSKSDAEAVRRLIGQLGYPLTADEVVQRIAMVLQAADHRTWVYEDDGAVVGILHAFYRPAFDNPPEVMVQALVVDASHRSRGVGEALMDVAENWAHKIGSGSVSLYSRADRDRAHLFYERLGYARAATSTRMRKTFAARAGR